MIIYDLICEQQHRFEGWFRSASDFEAQLGRQLVRCPQCDTATVRRIPSPVAIGGHHAAPVDEGTRSSTAAGMPASHLAPSKTQVLAVYRQVIQAVFENSEDVGRSFAEEARRIHYQEAPDRFIRGEATAEECASLREEGIEILNLPLIKEDELN